MHSDNIMVVMVSVLKSCSCDLIICRQTAPADMWQMWQKIQQLRQVSAQFNYGNDFSSHVSMCLSVYMGSFY